MARVWFSCNLNDVETRDGIFQGKGISVKVSSFLVARRQGRRCLVHRRA